MQTDSAAHLKGTFFMTDLQRKVELIRSIQSLQLPETLVHALDDAQQARAVIEAVDGLQHLVEQWN